MSTTFYMPRLMTPHPHPLPHTISSWHPLPACHPLHAANLNHFAKVMGPALARPVWWRPKRGAFLSGPHAPNHARDPRELQAVQQAGRLYVSLCGTCGLGPYAAGWGWVDWSSCTSNTPLISICVTHATGSLAWVYNLCLGLWCWLTMPCSMALPPTTTPLSPSGVRQLGAAICCSGMHMRTGATVEMPFLYSVYCARYQVLTT